MTPQLLEQREVPFAIARVDFQHSAQFTRTDLTRDRRPGDRGVHRQPNRLRLRAAFQQIRGLVDKSLTQRLPEGSVRQVVGGIANDRSLNRLLPITRPRHDLDEGCGLRVTDPQCPDDDAEEPRPLASVLVQPVEGNSVFLAKRLRDPNDRAGAAPGRVREELPKMRVIAPLDLVLNDECGVVGEVMPDEIQ